MTGYVYAIGSGDLVKFGYSADPWKRLSKIKSDNPHSPVILGAVVGTKKDEEAIHDRISEHHVIGDWFHRGHVAVEAEIEKMEPFLAPSTRRVTQGIIAEECPDDSIIRAFRRREGLTLDQIAERLSVTISAASRIERRETLQPELVVRIEKALGIPRHKLRHDLWPSAGAAS